MACDTETKTCNSGPNEGKPCQTKKDCNPSQRGGNRKIKVFNLLQFAGAKSNNNALSNWDHDEPKKYYNTLVEIYGKPDIIVNQKGGLCIWYGKRNDYYHHLELKDEYVPHCVPAQHYDFFYTYVKIYIPPDVFPKVMAISGSIGYDGLKKLLYARCGSIEANLATLATVFNTIRGSNPSYPDAIKNKDKNKNNNKKMIEQEVKINQNTYKIQLEQPYFDYAFPNGCNSKQNNKENNLESSDIFNDLDPFNIL